MQFFSVNGNNEDNSRNSRSSRGSTRKSTNMPVLEEYSDEEEESTCVTRFYDEILEKGIKFAPPQTSFYDHPQKKIITYAPEDLKHMLMPLLDHDLTACYDFWVWVKHISIVTYSIVLSIILAETSFPDSVMGKSGEPKLACADGQNLNMCLLETLLQDATGEFRFLIAFILAGFVAGSVSIWGTRRKGYGALVGNTKNCLVWVNSVIPRNGDPAKARQHISRWILLTYELAVLKARGHMDSNDGRDYLESLQLLQPGEWDCMASGDRHTTVIFWIQSMLMNYVRNGLIPDDSAATVMEAVSLMRGNANDLMSTLFYDRPISYVALTGLLVKINVLIFSTWKAVEWACWMRTFGTQDIFVDQARIYVDIFVLLAWNVSYTALYDLGYMLHNPFGNRRIDIPHEVVSSSVHRFAERIVKGGKSKESLPPAFSVPLDKSKK